MPKRGRSTLHSHFRAKRSRGRTGRKLVPKNAFASQLGGWSSYPHRRSKPTLRTFSTRIQTVTGVLSGTDVKGQLFISMGASIPQNIRDVFQRIRIKKIEAFFEMPDLPSGSNPLTVQVAVCRALQDDDSINPLTVPGAQIKFHRATTSSVGDNDGSADYLRAARFYPPILLANDEVPVTKDNWGDTSNDGVQWKCFNWQINQASGSRIPTGMQYYATITLLCDGQKA